MSRVIPAFQLYFDQEFVADVPINTTPFLIGRKTGCHLRLLDTSVSREHCRITVGEKGEITVEDLASTNGTLVNNERVVKYALQPSDITTLGRCTLIFHDLDPGRYEAGGEKIWSRLIGRSRHVKYTGPIGKYVLPLENSVTQFDAISYAMVRDQQHGEEAEKKSRAYLKRIPRLQVVAEGGALKEEVTKFNVSQNIFAGIDDRTLKAVDRSKEVFTQPKVRKPFFKLPWKIVERVIAPLLLAVTMIIVGFYVLRFHIDTQLEIAEKHWDQRLAKIGEKLQQGDESFLALTNAPAPATLSRPSSKPISIDEVWKQIDSRFDLRNYLLFGILDEVLTSKDIQWSIDEAMKNLSRAKSVTSRLPSVKSVRIVLNTEAVPFQMAGLGEGRILMFTDEERTVSMTDAYNQYRAGLTPRMASVSSCAGSRSSFAPGKVVLAFTIQNNGVPTSIFVNEDRSSKEPALWNCVRKTLGELHLPPPPGGRLSIVYTFRFGPAARVTF